MLNGLPPNKEEMLPMMLIFKKIFLTLKSFFIKKGFFLNFKKHQMFMNSKIKQLLLFLIFQLSPVLMNAQPVYVLQTKMDLATFDKIKNYIIKSGDKQTFRNFDNSNPHYSLFGRELYLGSDIGQKNIENNPKKSDFNDLTVISRLYSGVDLHLLAVRTGDIAAKKQWVQDDMKEGFVYVEFNKTWSIDTLEQHIDRLILEFNKTIKKNKMKK